MTPGSPEDAVSPSAATNNRVAAALADVAKLIGAHAYLPAPSYITCSPNYNNNPPLVDLWLDRPEDVTAWARKLGADVNVSNGSTKGSTFTTTTEAILSEPQSARVRLIHLARHDKPQNTRVKLIHLAKRDKPAAD
jgi:hypothetical protein